MRDGMLFFLVSFRTKHIYIISYKHHLPMKSEAQYCYIYHLVGQLAVINLQCYSNVVTSISSLKLKHLGCLQKCNPFMWQNVLAVIIYNHFPLAIFCFMTIPHIFLFYLRQNSKFFTPQNTLARISTGHCKFYRMLQFICFAMPLQVQ